MNTAITQAMTATAKTQTMSGKWDKVEYAADRQYLNLSNSTDGTDITISLRGCGKKASVYRSPMNKNNLIIVDNTPDGLDTGISKMYRRIKSNLRLVE